MVNKNIVIGLYVLFLSTVGIAEPQEVAISFELKTNVSAANRMGCFDCMLKPSNIPSFAGGYYSGVGLGSVYKYTYLGNASGSSYGVRISTIKRNRTSINPVVNQNEVLSGENYTQVIINDVQGFERPVILISRGGW